LIQLTLLRFVAFLVVDHICLGKSLQEKGNLLSSRLPPLVLAVTRERRHT
jgi:hypothetical protein